MCHWGLWSSGLYELKFQVSYQYECELANVYLVKAYTYKSVQIQNLYFFFRENCGTSWRATNQVFFLKKRRNNIIKWNSLQHRFTITLKTVIITCFTTWKTSKRLYNNVQSYKNISNTMHVVRIILAFKKNRTFF